MKSGRTVAGEREKAVSDSERQRVRKAAKNRKIRGIVFVLLACGLIAYLAVVSVKSWLEAYDGADVVVEQQNDYDLSNIMVIDENGGEITNGTKKYIWQMSGDLADLGYTLEKVVLPVGMLREVDLYIKDFAGYIKTNSDRDTAVSAEDIDRMMKYLGEHGIGEITYIDVRVSGKAYYK
ncbi:hypothetical protein IJI94_01825 [Candidatus Saccharibacteria bacterium]|nr:hypothetical protein [Candidatus Saccharibacteria bacterium]